LDTVVTITSEDLERLFEGVSKLGSTRPSPDFLRLLTEGLRLRPSKSPCCNLTWVLPGLGTQDREFGCLCKTNLSQLLEKIER